MVTLKADIKDGGFARMVVKATDVDRELAKIATLGFKYEDTNAGRTHRVYGTHRIDHIDIIPGIDG